MRALSANNPAKEKNNFIQTLDVRTRMLICVLMSVGVVFIDSWYILTTLLAASTVYVAAHGRLNVIVITYCVVLVMFTISIGCVQIMLIFWPTLGEDGLSPFVNPFLRVVVLLNVVLALAISGRIQEIMTTLRSLRLPFFIYLPATVMIRFIPSFINDVKQISQSMKTKGYNLNIMSLTFQPLLTIRLLFVPIVIRALRSSDELSVAAELKGLGYSRYHTRLNPTKMGMADTLTIIYATLLLGISMI
jgi:energy-coupling factor transport system permease protein